jgi:carboxyl-terminal processing protease
MLPAANQAKGQNVNTPDVCNTPAGTTTVPIPYVNVAQNNQAIGFAKTVMVEGSYALNIGTSVPTTSGDESGSAHPVTKQESRWVTGSATVYIECFNAVTLTSPSTGNACNAASGAAVVPSATTVFFTERVGDPARLDLAALRRLGASGRSAAGGVQTERRGTRAVLVVERFGADVAAVTRAELAGLGEAGVTEVLLDLRGNAGGSADAFVRLAELFLPKGALVAVVLEDDGDEDELRSRAVHPSSLPVSILVDEGTASAAELFAGCLKAHRRALVIGRRTYGKGTACRVMPGPDGPRYAVVARYRLPDGSLPDGVGVEPDVAVDAVGDAFTIWDRARAR